MNIVNFMLIIIFMSLIGIMYLIGKIRIELTQLIERVNNDENFIGGMDVEISDLTSELTEHEVHTNDAFKGSKYMYDMLKYELEHHCHSYNFDNGVLYIKEPIISEIPDELKESDFQEVEEVIDND